MKDGLGASFQLYQQVNLSVKKGQSVALTGPSGSGKSSLLAMIAGLEPFDEGTIELFGQSLNQLADEEICQLRAQYLGFVFQSFMLIPGFSASDNLQMASFIQGASLSFKQSCQALDEVGLADKANIDIAHLSGGEQQRVALARALVNRPQLLLADEPTGNLDPSTGARISDLMFRMNQEHQIGLVLATHDPILARRCDHIYVIEDGALHERT